MTDIATADLHDTCAQCCENDYELNDRGLCQFCAAEPDGPEDEPVAEYAEYDAEAQEDLALHDSLYAHGYR